MLKGKLVKKQYYIFIVLGVIALFGLLYYFLFKPSGDITGVYIKVEENGLLKKTYTTSLQYNKESEDYTLTYTIKVKNNDTVDEQFYKFLVDDKVALNKKVTGQYISENKESEGIEGITFMVTKKGLEITDLYSASNGSQLLLERITE